MEKFSQLFCNESDFQIVKTFVFNNNRTLYFFDNCFQQLFIQIPFYLLLLIVNSFYLGFYSLYTAHTIQISSQGSSLFRVFRILSLLFIILIQIANYFLQLPNVTLLHQLVALVKFCSLSLYFLTLTKSIFIYLERKIVLKVFIVLLLVIFIFDCLTSFLYQSNQIVFTLSILSGIFWSIHVYLVCKHDPQLQFRPELLINDSDGYAVQTECILPCDESYSFLSRGWFSWVSPLLDRGSNSEINSHNDLFKLPDSISAFSFSYLADKYLNQSSKKNFFVNCLFHIIGWRILVFVCISKLLADFLSFLFPIFLNKLLQYLENDTFNSRQGFSYAFVLLISTLLNALFISSFNFQMTKISLQIRALVVTLIYHKLFRVRSCTLSNNFATGEVLNLANIDIDRVVNFLPSIFQFISLPIQLLVTLYLLYSEVGLVFFSGLVFIICLIPLNKIICNKIGILSQEMMKWKDQRIKLMSEILKGMRTIKFHFWQDSFINKIQVLRQNEVKYLKWRKYLDALCVYFWATTPVIISSLVFGTFVLYYGEQSLTSSKVFTSLALLGMLIMPLNALPWVLNGLIEALVSVRRINKFLLLNEVDLVNDYQKLSEENDTVFEMEDCTFVHNDLETSQTNDSAFKLSNINAQIKEKTYVGIIGKVGSGKSSFLKCLLNELHKTNGRIKIKESLLNKGFGYVSQEPWILNTSIRENILFGKDYDADFYRTIIDACDLSQDFQVLQKGDQTMVGDQGSILSGGQKSRISLARALYQNFDVYLIDEPFSSIDVNVAQIIYQNVFKNILQNKCILLVTNHVQYLENCGNIICLEGGTLTHSNKLPNNLKHSLNANKPKLSSDMSPQILLDDNTTPPEIIEEREIGVVKFNVYSAYIHSIGYFLFAIILVSIFLMQTSKSASDFWLSLWTKNKNVSESLKYLYIFIGIAIANSIITLIRAFVFALGGVHAAVILHDRLLQSVMKTSIIFFDLTAFGIIINRFSSNTFNVDDALPFTLNIFLSQLSGLVAGLIITVYGMPLIFLVIILLIIPYYLIQKFYRATSRELERLSAVSLSPIYSQLDDTIQGLSIIRSFAQTQRFKKTFYDKVNVYSRIQYAMNAVQQWLNVRLQMLGVVVTSSVAFGAVYMHYYHTEQVNSGLIGLSLVYSLTLTSLLNGTVQTFTQTELDLISVERIIQILKSTAKHPEHSKSVPFYNVGKFWPSGGVISFRNVCMRYRTDLDLALNNISFETEPGEHIAIVGRTGSGKSSIFQTLFRLTNLESGAILIDGLDISKIDIQTLRSRIFIIPQDPFLFSGTIRDNLDPLNQFRDDEIWTALYSCNINIFVDSLGGLDSELQESGKDLSVGQRHLLCLARAVLNKRKILCMDEVTANIDSETESVFDELLNTTLRCTTILHIAHKFQSIRNYDRIIELDEGQVVYVGSVNEYIHNHK